MRILLTNDDGIHAPGLEALEKIARELSDDLWIVSPETEQSGASHSLTLHDPLRIRQIEERRFAIKGTPTDCVIIGVRHLMKDRRPDLIMSGVNRGQNIADDVTYSGTIAGAFEGTLIGIPSVALSQAYGFERGSAPRWDVAEAYGADVMRKLIEAGIPKGIAMNVNFPDVAPEDCAGIAVTRQGRRDQDLLNIDERIDARGTPYYWIGFQRRLSKPAVGTDLWAIYEGYISVTPLTLDLTHGPSSETLREVFSSDADGLPRHNLQAASTGT